MTYDARTYPAAKEAFEMEKPIETAKKLLVQRITQQEHLPR